MDHLSRRFAFLGVAIVLVLALGTAGFILIEGWPLVRRVLHDADHHHHGRIHGNPRR